MEWLIGGAVVALALFLLFRPRRGAPEPAEASAAPSASSGMRISIEYQDSDGDLSRRDVTITGMDGERAPNGSVSITRFEGFCHLRQEGRNFRVDRVRSLAMDAGAPVRGEAAIAAAFARLFARAEQRPDAKIMEGKRQAAQPPPPGPVARLGYTDGDGRETERDITLLSVETDRWLGSSDAVRAWCHTAGAERTFVLSRMRWIADGTTGEVHEGLQAALWALHTLGEAPCNPIPEYPPGARVSTRRPNPPIAAVLAWERTPGDLETFDIAIDEVELAGGVPFAFSGRASRRASATDRRWTGRRRFKLRGWDTPEAPILWLAEAGSEAPLTAPHRWLAEQTRR